MSNNMSFYTSLQSTVVCVYDIKTSPFKVEKHLNSEIKMIHTRTYDIATTLITIRGQG